MSEEDTDKEGQTQARVHMPGSCLCWSSGCGRGRLDWTWET